MAAELNKAFGDGTVRVGSDPSLVVKYLRTGVLPIDVLLKGGIPRGRSTEIFGDYSVLKSFIALRTIATTQEAGGTCALVDTEHSYDPQWLEILGGDPDELIVEHPPFGEKAIEVSEVLIRSNVDLIVWDSIAATITKNSVEKRASEDVQPARLAAFMSRALPRLTAANSGHTAMLWINQTRANVGMTFGPTETTPGGRSMPFYASYRVRMAKAGKITDEVKVWDGTKYVNTKQRVGIKIRTTLEKSKLNTPDREAWFSYDLKAADIDDLGFLMAQGLEHGFITMDKGNWRLAKQGRKSVRGEERFRASLSEQDVTWLMNQLGVPVAQAPVNLKGKALSPGRKSPGRRGPVKKKVTPRRSAS